jgi:hypothetical protein
MTRRGGRGPALAASALLAAALLTGCSGASDGANRSGGTVPTRTPSAAATTSYPSGAPTDTVLTEPGSDLALGEGATVSWQPRQGVVGTLWISVDRVVPTTFEESFKDWRVDAKTRTFTPYFVYARVANLGDVDLAGAGVPLYGESAANALVEPAVFKETFKPCNPSTLPRPFPARATASVCLVYLVPDRGSLVGAAFRPTEEFAPITWEEGAEAATATPKS